jgi:hypothetical protein
MKKEIVILYHNGEYDMFEGSLDDAIDYLKCDSRYKDYGRGGATILEGKEIYSISDEPKETRND